MSITRNPEDDVCDTIAQLVDESLSHGPTDDYDRPYLQRCELCDNEWHGLTGDGEAGVHGCPGAYATEEQAQVWREWWWPTLDADSRLGTVDGAPWVIMPAACIVAHQELIGRLLLYRHSRHARS